MSLIVDGFSEVTPLDRGGFGSVYRATRISTRGTVALKQLDAGRGADEELLERRLRREIAALVALKGHPNVVQVEEMVMAPDGPVIVMEFMDAGSVAKLIEMTSPSAERIAYIGSSVTAGLAAAHNAGIVHRDVKPHNILMNTFGQVKLCDFGIAAILRSTEAHTRTTSLSVRYASPEELDDDPGVGPATDVYSLGASLHHLLYGAPPSFRDRGVPDPDVTILRHSDNSVRRTLGLIVAQCLQHEPNRRPTAPELYDLLAGLGSTSPTISRNAGGPPASDLNRSRRLGAGSTGLPVENPLAPSIAASSPVTDELPASYLLHQHQPARPSAVGWWVATGVALLVLIAGSAWAVFGRTTSNEGASASNDRGSTDVAATDMAGSSPADALETASSAVSAAVPVVVEVVSTTTTTTLAPAPTLAPLPPEAVTTSAPLVQPIATSPALMSGAPTFEQSEAAFVTYLTAAAERRYGDAWTLLTSRYQAKYRSYDRFVRFWETIDGAGVRSSESVGGSDTFTTLSNRVWFGRRNDGTVSNEIVEVDFVSGPNGSILIDDYRYIGDDG